MRVGITGHQILEKRLEVQGALQSEVAAWEWVDQAFAGFLKELPSREAVVISSLAGGADQHLARVALEQGAKIEVVIPSAKYAETFSSSAERTTFEHLLHHATTVVRLDNPAPTEQAFLSAGRFVVDHSEMVVAVWDGQQAEGLGGTADIVGYCLQKGHPTLQINPIVRVLRWLSKGE
jgi:hypothetical protein